MENNQNKKIKKKKKKLRKCKNIIKGRGICNNIIKDNNKNKCEYCLEKNFSSDTDEEYEIKRKKTIILKNNILPKEELKEEQVKIKIYDDTQSEYIDTSGDEANKKFIFVEISNELKKNIDKRKIDIYKEIKKLVEDNIAIIKPSIEIGNELIRFLRFIEIQLIIWETDREQEIYYTDYKSLGVVNNLAKLIDSIKNKLQELSKEEQNIFLDFISN